MHELVRVREMAHELVRAMGPPPAQAVRVLEMACVLTQLLLLILRLQLLRLLLLLLLQRPCCATTMDFAVAPGVELFWLLVPKSEMPLQGHALRHSRLHGVDA